MRRSFVIFLLVLMLAFFAGFLGVLAHAQTVDVSQFPGATKYDKLTNAMANGCKNGGNDANVYGCLLIMGPDMSQLAPGNYGPGTSGSLCAMCLLLDYSGITWQFWGDGQPFDVGAAGNFYDVNRVSIQRGGLGTKNLQVYGSVFTSTGIKHQRQGSICSTAASALATCNTVLTWTGGAWKNASYTPVCIGKGATNGAILTWSAATTTQITLTVIAPTAAAATFTEVDCIAMHD